MLLNKKIVIIIGFFVASMLLFGGVYIFQYLYNRNVHYPSGTSDFDSIGEYKINPETILSELEMGKSDVFIKSEDDSVIYYNLPAFWRQKDYLRISEALFNFVWNENTDKWRIYGLVFFRKCADNPIGFESGSITYYQYTDWSKDFTIRETNIFPLNSKVNWEDGGKFRKPLFGLKYIDISKLKVTADDALNLAEEKGGAEFRAKVKNSCNILLVLKPNPDDTGWLVAYSTYGSSDNFRINIDPY